MYENLLQLPYFQGMSKDEITAILDKVTIEFFSYNDGETICRFGEECALSNHSLNRLYTVCYGLYRSGRSR